MDSEQTGLQPLRVAERIIPPPMSLSRQARETLSVFSAAGAVAAYPALEDVASWKALVKASNEGIGPMVFTAAHDAACQAEPIDLGGVASYRAAPRHSADGTSAVLFDLHGGGLILGGGDLARRFALKTAAEYDVEVFAPDYRMPPDFPYPTPLDDCVAAYLALIERRSPERIIVQGASAGGNLAAALMLRLRELGAPFPAGLILQSPEIDLTESGDSFRTNLGVDTMLRDTLMPMNLLYANGHDLRDPMLSPLFADLSKGFPPTVISTGTRDLFLSNAVRFHKAIRRAGGSSELIVMEAMPHGGFLGAPEDAELVDELRGWAQRVWREASQS